VRISRLLLLIVLLAGAASPAAARRPEECAAGYAYVGAESPTRAYGVSATLTTMSTAVVQTGHVAAWIGVGGPALGPGDSDEWLQAGIARDAGGNDVLYYEFKRPGDSTATYVPLDRAVIGEAYDFVVYERATEPDTWRVQVDGMKVGDPISLPGSHGAFQPIATAENWDGGVAGTCNDYRFDFANLALRTQYGGLWQAFQLTRVLRDPAYSMRLRASGFVASSR